MRVKNQYAPADHHANQLVFTKHKKRKNNDLVAAMYAMYQANNSIGAVGEVYHRSRQCIYQIFKRRGYELRSKKLAGLTMVQGHRFTFMKDGYLRGTVNGRRIMLHQFIWEQVNGPIPVDHVLHHKDNNRANNSIDNLELVAKKDMARKFNPKGNNQYTKCE